MWFRIMAKSSDGKTAYAERVESFTVMDDGRAFVRGYDSGCYFAGVEELIENPEIVSRCSADWLYKIKLEG